jgi:hypothetical protein
MSDICRLAARNAVFWSTGKGSCHQNDSEEANNGPIANALVSDLKPYISENN